MIEKIGNFLRNCGFVVVGAFVFVGLREIYLSAVVTAVIVIVSATLFLLGNKD
jgi:hypothetical protein